MDDMLRVGDVSINITSSLDDILSCLMTGGWVVTKDVKVDNGRTIYLDYSDCLYILLIGDLSGNIELLRLQAKKGTLLDSCNDLCLCGITKDKFPNELGAMSPKYTASWIDKNSVKHTRYVWSVKEMLCAAVISNGEVKCVSVAGKSYEDDLPHVVVYNKRPICIGKPAPYKLPENRNVILTLDDKRVVTGIRCINFGDDDGYNVPTLAEDISMSKILGNWYRASTPNGACIKLESDKYVVTLHFKDPSHIECADMKAVV